MKKTLALFLALMLALSLQPACASGLFFTPTEAAPAPAADVSLATETLTLECGITLPVPVEWSDGPLPASFQIENALFSRYDGEGRFMQMRTHAYGSGSTVESMTEAFAADENFAGVKLHVNPLGQKVLYTEAANGKFLSLMVFDGEGTAYILTFGNFFKDKRVVDDPVSMWLVSHIMDSIRMGSAAAPSATAEPADDMLYSNGVEYEELISHGFRFLYPANWTYQPPTDEQREAIIFMQMMDDENGYVMEGRLEFPEEGTTIKDCCDAMKADTDTYGDVITGNNEMGYPVIIFKHRDNLAAGYAALDPDGVLFVFTFSTTDGSLVPNHTDLTAIIAHCATYVCTVDEEEPAPGGNSAGQDFDLHTLNNALTIPCPKDWNIGGNKEDHLFRAAHPESGVYFYVRMNTYGQPRDPQQVYEAFAAGDKIGYAELITGKDGLQIIRADSADGTFSALMIPDDVGNVYIITLTGKGNMQVLEEESFISVRDLLISEMTLK